jgi:hypothetical protein
MVEVNVKVEHPDFKCDVTMPEKKVTKFLKNIKKELKENISVTTKVIKKDENKGK